MMGAKMTAEDRERNARRKANPLDEPDVIEAIERTYEDLDALDSPRGTRGITGKCAAFQFAAFDAILAAERRFQTRYNCLLEERFQSFLVQYVEPDYAAAIAEAYEEMEAEEDGFLKSLVFHFPTASGKALTISIPGFKHSGPAMTGAHVARESIARALQCRTDWRAQWGGSHREGIPEYREILKQLDELRDAIDAFAGQVRAVAAELDAGIHPVGLKGPARNATISSLAAATLARYLRQSDPPWSESQVAGVFKALGADDFATRDAVHTLLRDGPGGSRPKRTRKESPAS